MDRGTHGQTLHVGGRSGVHWCVFYLVSTLSHSQITRTLARTPTRTPTRVHAHTDIYDMLYGTNEKHILFPDGDSRSPGSGPTDAATATGDGTRLNMDKIGEMIGVAGPRPETP